MRWSSDCKKLDLASGPEHLTCVRYLPSPRAVKSPSQLRCPSFVASSVVRSKPFFKPLRPAARAKGTFERLVGKLLFVPIYSALDSAFGSWGLGAGVLLSIASLIISFLLSRSFAVVTLIALSRRNSKFESTRIVDHCWRSNYKFAARALFMRPTRRLIVWYSFLHFFDFGQY